MDDPSHIRLGKLDCTKLGEFSGHPNAPTLWDRDWLARIDGNAQIAIDRTGPLAKRAVPRKKNDFQMLSAQYLLL
jgi:hypothetical protein